MAPAREKNECVFLVNSITCWPTGKSNIMVCPPARGDNPQALASGLSPVKCSTKMAVTDCTPLLDVF